MKIATLVLVASIIALLSACARADNTVTLDTLADFFNFANTVSNGESYNGTTVLLNSDINFKYYQPLAEFTPIGNKAEACFQGTFDGQGHVISDFVLMNENNNKYHGLFGYSQGATIRNLIIDTSCKFDVISIYEKYAIIGSIIGYCGTINGPCRIESCLSQAAVSFENEDSVSDNVLMGGLAGELIAYNYLVTIKNSGFFSGVHFNCISMDNLFIGGLVGRLKSDGDSDSSILNCISKSDIFSGGTINMNANIGSIVGLAKGNKVTIDNTAALGELGYTGSNGYVGGLVGYIESGSVTHSYYDGELNLEACGKITNQAKITECLAFHRQEYTLTSAVTVGEYSGDSLIEALNAGSDLNDNNDYSHWINSGYNCIKFYINGNYIFKPDATIVMMPDLTDTGNRKFDGWYTDESYLNNLTSYVLYADTNLYGEYK